MAIAWHNDFALSAVMKPTDLFQSPKPIIVISILKYFYNGNELLTKIGFSNKKFEYFVIQFNLKFNLNY